MQSFRSSCRAKIRCPHFCVPALLRLQAYGGRSPTTCRAKASKLEAIDKIFQGFLRCSLHWICCRFFSIHAGCGLIWASQALFASISVIFPFLYSSLGGFHGTPTAASGAEWLLDEECPLLPDLEEANHRKQTHIATSVGSCTTFFWRCASHGRCWNNCSQKAWLMRAPLERHFEGATCQLKKPAFWDLLGKFSLHQTVLQDLWWRHSGMDSFFPAASPACQVRLNNELGPFGPFCCNSCWQLLTTTELSLQHLRSAPCKVKDWMELVLQVPREDQYVPQQCLASGIYTCVRFADKPL